MFQCIVGSLSFEIINYTIFLIILFKIAILNIFLMNFDVQYKTSIIIYRMIHFTKLFFLIKFNTNTFSLNCNNTIFFLNKWLIYIFTILSDSCGTALVFNKNECVYVYIKAASWEKGYNGLFTFDF